MWQSPVSRRISGAVPSLLPCSLLIQGDIVVPDLPVLLVWLRFPPSDSEIS